MVQGFKKLRVLAGLTQQQAADLIGVSSQAVQKWEYGSAQPKPKLWGKIAETYKTTEEVILGIVSGEEVVFNATGEVVTQVKGEANIGEIHNRGSTPSSDIQDDVAPIVSLLNMVNDSVPPFHPPPCTW